MSEMFLIKRLSLDFLEFILPTRLKMNKLRQLTHNIKQLGFSGLRGFGSRFNFSSVDKDALRKPNRFILSTLGGMLERRNTII